MNRSRPKNIGARALLALALGAAAVLALAAFAAAKDRNGDRIPDRWEVRHHLSLKVDQSRRDQDGDHLRNRAEFLADDNPRDRDSDDDGVIDGNENNGTIASFDAASGRLVINAFGGDTLAGKVTARTRIECGGHHHGRGHQEAGDDNGGRGEAEPGDDHGGRGENEPGDDHGGGDNSGPGSSHERRSDDDQEGTCTVADLVSGAAVHEAELELEHGQIEFREVELAR